MLAERAVVARAGDALPHALVRALAGRDDRRAARNLCTSACSTSTCRWLTRTADDASGLRALSFNLHCQQALLHLHKFALHLAAALRSFVLYFAQLALAMRASSCAACFAASAACNSACSSAMRSQLLCTPPRSDCTPGEQHALFARVLLALCCCAACKLRCNCSTLSCNPFSRAFASSSLAAALRMLVALLLHTCLSAAMSSCAHCSCRLVRASSAARASADAFALASCSRAALRFPQGLLQLLHVRTMCARHLHDCSESTFCIHAL